MKKKRRVVFCTFSSIYSSIVLNHLLAEKSVEVVAIVNSTRVLTKNGNHFFGAIKQIKLSGIKYAFYLFLVTDFFRFLQYFFLNSSHNLKSIQKIAKSQNIPLMNTRDINSSEVVKFIENNSAEYLLAAHFNQLVKDPLINHPKIHCYNIHPSLLPSYKGVDPVFFALLDRQKAMGVTLHKMSDEFDNGEIIEQKSIEINTMDSVFSANKKLFEIGVNLAIKNMHIEGEHDPVAYEKRKESYDTWPSKEQTKRFKQQGRKLIGLSSYVNTFRNTQ